MVNLLFSQPAAPSAGPVHLVFGDDTSAPTRPDATLSGALHITGLHSRASLRSGVVLDAATTVSGVHGHIALGCGAVLQGSGRITALRGHVALYAGQILHSHAKVSGLRGHVAVHYDSNVARPLATSADVCWQAAQPVQSAARAQHSASATTSATALTRWQPAQQADSVGLRTPWQHTRPVQSPLSTAWQQAQSISTGRLQQHWQVAMPLQAAALALHNDTQRVQSEPLFTRWQDTWRDHAVMRTTRMQGAAAQAGTVGQRLGSAAQVLRGLATRHQDTRPVPNGRSLRPPPNPPRPPPCYVPTLPARLLFADPADRTLPAKLRFVCEGRTPPPPAPNKTVIVPIRGVYMTINTLVLRRVDGDVPIPAYSFGMNLDVDSWTWSWRATLHTSALPLIQPSSNGDPVDIEAVINGAPYRLTAEGYNRQREFGSTQINVHGRGRAAILDAPYAPTLHHASASDLMAQQLMAQALTINGVGIGWDVDWGLTDWFVPGGTWSHQGTYISALLDIASAAGAYVQPHTTQQTLRILPRYPAAPWHWNDLAPDFELPAAVVSTEAIEWKRKTPYNRAHISGTTSSGIFAEVRRAGTAGDSAAPMVTHALITHADAARQRGIALLSDTGNQAHVSLKLPVLAETGLIHPGALVRYVDGAETRIGLVRSTALEWSLPVLSQTISVETHIF